MTIHLKGWLELVLKRTVVFSYLLSPITLNRKMYRYNFLGVCLG
jgi:hypothetical protein